MTAQLGVNFRRDFSQYFVCTRFAKLCIRLLSIIPFLMTAKTIDLVKKWAAQVFSRCFDGYSQFLKNVEDFLLLTSQSNYRNIVRTKYEFVWTKNPTISNFPPPSSIWHLSLYIVALFSVDVLLTSRDRAGMAPTYYNSTYA